MALLLAFVRERRARLPIGREADQVAACRASAYRIEPGLPRDSGSQATEPQGHARTDAVGERQTPRAQSRVADDRLGCGQ
jgi:hypothetical protein